MVWFEVERLRLNDYVCLSKPSSSLPSLFFCLLYLYHRVRFFFSSTISLSDFAKGY